MDHSSTQPEDGRPGKIVTEILRDRRGVALLLILWVVTFLAVICAELSWTMRTETATARNFKEGEQAYYAAEAGINRALIELLRTANSPSGAKKTDEESEEEEATYWEAGMGPYSFKLDGYSCEVLIEDEGNKIGINTMLNKGKIIHLKKLLEDRIGLEGEERDIVADSLVDWRDKDHNITGVNGAEDDYYKSLEQPYECRDAVIPVLEELLLIRGINEDMYYGVAGKPDLKVKLSSDDLERMLSGAPLSQTPAPEPVEEGEVEQIKLGLMNIFSVNGQGTYPPRIDINTATFDQLLLLEGMSAAAAQEIIKARNERKFESKTDRLPEFANYEIWKGSLKPVNTRRRTSGYYKITATGYSQDKLISRSISCHVLVSKRRCIVSSWKAVD